MKSIRVFLVTVILSVITLIIFIAALKGYQSSMDEAETLFDKQLLDTATLIANFPTDQSTTRFRQNSTIAFQVWRRGELVATSSNAPSTRIAPLVLGFNYSNFNGYRWRTVAFFDNANENWVLAAERTDLRYALAENIILESVFPIFISIPLLGILIWIIVSRGLRPLRKFADELESKQADDLSPLSYPFAYQELKQIGGSSNRLLGRLETSLLREKQFASDAAHELRTPICALKVQLHNLSEELPESGNSTRELTDTIDRLEHVVEQILDLYRSSPDQFNASFKRVDLTALVQEVLASEYEQFDLKNQTLEFEGEACSMLGDRFALTTLLQNLLSNASKYTPAGGQIGVSIKQSPLGIALTVEDSGPGIPPHERQTVFERFYRIGRDRHASGESGCGLGLAIVKRIVELHNASISIEPSGFATGTAFQVSFPVSQQSDL